MAIVRRDSRSRVGVVWFDSEAEADEHASRLEEVYGRQAIEQANVGVAQCGRDRGLDAAGEYAVVTP